jgi:hypothetical protein
VLWTAAAQNRVDDGRRNTGDARERFEVFISHLAATAARDENRVGFDAGALSPIAEACDS